MSDGCSGGNDTPYGASNENCRIVETR